MKRHLFVCFFFAHQYGLQRCSNGNDILCDQNHPDMFWKFRKKCQGKPRVSSTWFVQSLLLPLSHTTSYHCIEFICREREEEKNVFWIREKEKNVRTYPPFFIFKARASILLYKRCPCRDEESNVKKIFLCSEYSSSRSFSFCFRKK